MSRFYINLLIAGRIDDEAVIGYEPEIRLGTCLEEFPTLQSIVEEARSRGYEINGLRPADVIAMLADVGPKPEPTIWERIGPIF